MDKLSTRRGQLVASVLTRSWHRPQPDLHASAEELTEVAPLLMHSGAGSLGWTRAHHSGLTSNPQLSELRQAYRLHSLQAAVHELEIKRIVQFIRSVGHEPLLGKGWAIARLYPERGLRPYGDVDLYVPLDEYAPLSSALSSGNAPPCPVDLHRGAAELDDRSFADLYARSHDVRLGEESVRVFGPEDNLRLLCLHTLRHGAWRPLWLCDIAVGLEQRPTDFDWDYFLSGNRSRSDWVACAIGLAHQLLGASVDGTPVEWRAKHLPKWFVPTALSQWGKFQRPHGCRPPMKSYLRHPNFLIEALRVRWPNPIEATIGVRGPFNELPRLPFQIGDALLRTAKFLTHLTRSSREPV